MFSSETKRYVFPSKISFPPKVRRLYHITFRSSPVSSSSKFLLLWILGSLDWIFKDLCIFKCFPIFRFLHVILNSWVFGSETTTSWSFFNARFRFSDFEWLQIENPIIDPESFNVICSCNSQLNHYHYLSNKKSSKYSIMLHNFMNNLKYKKIYLITLYIHI